MEHFKNKRMFKKKSEIIKFDTIFNNVKQHAICIVDQSGTVIRWNKVAEKLTHYTEIDMVGQKYSKIFSEKNNQKVNFDKFTDKSTNSATSRFEVLCLTKKGINFWGDFCVDRIDDPSNNLGLFIVIFQDITDKKKREEEKDEYIGVASHELRTPVTSLLLYAELLKDYIGSQMNKDAGKIFNDMKGQIKRILNLTEDLLVMNEIERRKLTLNKNTFNINTFIKKIINNFKTTTISHNLKFNSEVKGLVFGDENRLTQVLINIIGNAIKYSPISSEVIISVKPKGQKVIISVQDFGRGIGIKEKANIFKRYFRSYSLDKGNLPGLGLGLYISKEIIANHNEKIWVKSKKGVGSTFYFSLSRPSL